MKPMLAILLMIVFSAAVAAHSGDFSEAKQLIESKVPCSELSEGQLELVGEYYMEQMHAGELHEIMDERMGGEGSESLRLVHIRMAQSFYCGDDNAMDGGMMNMMGNYGYGMMSNSSNLFGASLLWLLYVAIGAFVFSVIFWWTYTVIVKSKGKKK